MDKIDLMDNMNLMDNMDNITFFRKKTARGSNGDEIPLAGVHAKGCPAIPVFLRNKSKTKKLE